MNTSVLQKFSQHSRNVLRESGNLAATRGQTEITPTHLLLALCQERGSVAQDVLTNFGFTPEGVSGRLSPNPMPAQLPASPELGRQFARVMVRAVYLAHTNAHTYVGTEHLLAALLELKDREVETIFSHQHLDRERLDVRLDTVLQGSSRFPDMSSALDYLSSPAEPAEGLQTKTNSPSALEYFGTELTHPDEIKGIDPVIGRADEINRLIHVLCRRTKNNPVLVGPAGVGKTAIVEGLAKRIAEGSVPDALSGKRIYRLDLAALVAGTSFRGEFEQRLRQICLEAKKNPDVIIFIDELHAITGAGSANGSLDAATLLKPALARGEIRCVGATTPEDYKKYIEPDPALERRFQPITVQPPSPANTLEMLRGLRTRYEEFHRINIPDDALQSAVSLADRYLTDRHLPDKAIDVLDEAAAALAIQTPNPAATKARGLENELRELHEAMHRSIEEENFVLAQALRKKEGSLLQRLETLRANRSVPPAPQASPAAEAHGLHYGASLTPQTVAEVISRTTGVPTAELIKGERDRLRSLETELGRHIIGQFEAVSSVAAVIRRSRTGLTEARRPLGSFLFLGPSGVGKTELAKVLARQVLGSPDALVSIDCSELSEAHGISKLIGSPAGYVGFREGARLADAVRARPYSIVLFDEIEKAHPALWNLLLQIFDEGRLTDGAGRNVNFSQAIIVMTSNLGSRPAGAQASIGFGSGMLPGSPSQISPEQKEFTLQQLKQTFRPEFLNRIDSVCHFNQLGLDELKAIARLQLDGLRERLRARGISLTCGPAVAALVARQAAAAEQGARGIRKIIQVQILDPIANKLLEQPTTAIKILSANKELRII